jgi:uncharacterized membrane protein YvbJ
MTPKYCSNCGTKAATPTAKFCASCGTPFVGATSLAAKPPVRQLDEEGSDIDYVPQIDSLDATVTNESDGSYSEFQAGASFSILPDGQSSSKIFKQRRITL